MRHMKTRKTAGRPKLVRSRLTTTLPPRHIAALQHIGDGSAQAGIMKLVEAWASEYPATAKQLGWEKQS